MIETIMAIFTLVVCGYLGIKWGKNGWFDLTAKVSLSIITIYNLLFILGKFGVITFVNK